jgi:DNA modification methylase
MPPLPLPRPVLETPDGLMLYLGDCLKVMPRLPAGTFSAVFADPPYNIGVAYDSHDDAMTRAEYLTWSRAWVGAAARLLVPGGAFWLMCHAAYLADVEREVVAGSGLGVVSRVIWRYTFGQNQRARFTPSWVPLLYCYRTDGPRHFDPDRVRVRSRRQEIGDKRANPAGKVPDDVWDDVPRIPGNAKVRRAHPCQLPEELVARALRATVPAGGSVLDPFAGTGTTLAVCRAEGFRGTGVEVSERYAVDCCLPRLGAGT